MSGRRSGAGAGRAAVLDRLRTSLGVGAEDADRRVAVQKRMYNHARHLIPARAHEPNPKVRLVEMLEGQSADVIDVDGEAAIAGAIAAYLRDNNLPARVRHGADPLFETIDWRGAPGVEREVGPAKPGTVASLSRAVGAAAETGTLFLASGPDNPTTLNFLPEVHIVLLFEDEIVGPYEDLWDRLRAHHGERALPRTVNLISGPSRTADIEQTLTLGAHGPKRLCVMLIAR
ncbi:MAG: LUD domain-containing protein [Pseudomonadota bacterium]